MNTTEYPTLKPTNPNRWQNHTVRRMNDDTYRLRRQVINLIYEAKRLVPSLPRINVRITDAKQSHILGTAQEGARNIAITAEAVEGTWDLKSIVYHEILHAVYSQPHVAGCPLMGASLKSGKQDSDLLDSLFVKYVKDA